jgi:hypothetical protein
MLENVGIDPATSMKGFEKWSPILEGVLSEVARHKGQGGINMEVGQCLFGIVRALRPEFVIETGIAAGVSSCFLISALIENGSGLLYSVDLPANDNRGFICADASRYDWPEKGVGWAIPSEIKSQIGNRHILVLDDVRNALPQLLSKLPYIDVFFHDDLHLPEHMLWEYESVWRRLRKGGVLASHDVNMAWIRFCREHNLLAAELVNLNRLGAVQKLSEMLPACP